MRNPVERDNNSKVMKLYKFLPVPVICAFLWAGCGSQTGRVHVAPAGPAVAGQEPAAVEIFDVGEAPEKPFREIAHLSYDGVGGEYFQVVHEFVAKARELGADAIILDHPVTHTGDRYPYEHFVYRATAIAWQNKGATASR